MKQKIGEKSIFINMCVHLVTVFSLIILLGSSIYFVSMRNYFTQKVIAYNEQILKQSISTYEVFLNSTIESAMIYLERDGLESVTNDTSEPYLYDSQIYDRLNNVAKISDFVYSVYYFDYTPESIYISSGFRFDTAEFYDKEFIETLDYKKNYYILPARQLPTLDSGTKDIIPIVINLPLNAMNYSCTYVINIDANRLFNYLIKNSSFDSNLIFKIVDYKNMILASSENDVFQKLGEFSPSIVLDKAENSMIVDYKGNQQLVSYCKSSKYEWWYICYVDRSLVFSDILKPLKVILAIALSSLLISILFSIYMSKKFYQPVKDIMGILGEKISKKRNINEYDLIKESLNRYLGENKQFKKTIDSNKASLRHQFLYSLVTMNIYTKAQIEEKIAWFNLELMDSFIVLVIAIDNEDIYLKKLNINDRMVWELSLEDMATTALKRYGKGFFVNFESGKFALVLSLDSDTTEESGEKSAAGLAYELKETCKSLLKFSLTIGIGRMKNSPEMINASFKESMKALTFKDSIGYDEVILYNEVIIASSTAMEYPHNIENELVQHLFTGEIEKADAALHSLFKQFTIQRVVLPMNLHIFSVRLLSTLVKLIMELGINEEELVFKDDSLSTVMEVLLKATSEKECIEQFSKILYVLSEIISKKRNTATNEHVNLMIDYIEKNYKQIVSLDIIADYTKLNRCYAGRIFKQYTNMSIVDYVNQVRIKKAVSLLETTSLKVNDIAVMVGFNNTNYFIQMFKKIMHTTPGQYKENRQILG